MVLGDIGAVKCSHELARHKGWVGEIDTNVGASPHADDAAGFRYLYFDPGDLGHDLYASAQRQEMLETFGMTIGGDINACEPWGTAPVTWRVGSMQAFAYCVGNLGSNTVSTDIYLHLISKTDGFVYYLASVTGVSIAPGSFYVLDIAKSLPLYIGPDTYELRHTVDWSNTYSEQMEYQNRALHPSTITVVP